MILSRQFFAATGLILGLGAVVSAMPVVAKPKDVIKATASLKTGEGQDAGRVIATQRKDGVRIAITATGLAPGDHGVHVHMTGKCEGPKFVTAGGHWNPRGSQHGLNNPQGHHDGDMTNLAVKANGRGKMAYTLRNARLTDMLDADGAALVVHAKVDDQITDPSGNSGDRLLCGVFVPG